MKFYSVTYDLRAPGQNYEPLYKALRSFGTFAKPTESQWLLKTSLSSREIYDKLSPYLDTNDLIFVAAIDPTDVWWRLTTEIANWVTNQALEPA